MAPADNAEALPERFEDLEPAERLRVLKAGSAMTHFVFARAAAVLLSVPVGQTGYIRSGSAFVLRLPGLSGHCLARRDGMARRNEDRESNRVPGERPRNKPERSPRLEGRAERHCLSAPLAG